MKLLRIITLLSLMLMTTMSVFAQTAVTPSGSGTPSSPYLIETWQNLYWITQTPSSWGSRFLQTSDIDLEDGDVQNWDSGAGFSPIGNNTTKFSGQYNGNGFIIDNLYLNRVADGSLITHIGMFGVVNNPFSTYGDLGKVMNLSLTNISIEGSGASIGGLAGVLESRASAERVYVQGVVNATLATGNALAGGIAGFVIESRIVEAGAVVDIELAANYAGGIAGYVAPGSQVFDVYARGSISANNSGFLGGLIGYAQGGAGGLQVDRSYVDLEIIGTGLSDWGPVVGGSNLTSIQFGSIFFSEESVYGQYALGESKSVTQLKDPATYAIWTGFGGNWFLNVAVNDGFPVHFWQYPDPFAFFVPEEPVNAGDPDAGSLDNPIQIATWEHLYWMMTTPGSWDKLFIQTADIDLEDGEIRDWNSGTGWATVGTIAQPFTGGYDGDLHIIRNLFIDTENEASSEIGGMFGIITNPSGASGTLGTIKNLILEDVDITANSRYLGGIVAELDNDSRLERVSLSGSVASTYTDATDTFVGGLAGSVRGGSVLLLTRVDADVSSTGSSVGGAIGSLVSGFVLNSFAQGSVSGTNLVGGFVGDHGTGAESVTMQRSLANVTVNSTGTNNAFTAGTVESGLFNVFGLYGREGTYSFQSGFTTYVQEVNMGNFAALQNLNFTDTWFVNASHNNGVADLRWYGDWLDPALISFDPSMSVAPSNIGEPDAGTEANPYLIATWENLFWLTHNEDQWDKHYLQVNDIDLNDGDIENWEGGRGWKNIGSETAPFTGVYDGDNFRISNLYLNRVRGQSHIGMFGYISNPTAVLGERGVVQNLILDGLQISTDAGAVGGITGFMGLNTQIKKSSVQGQIVSNQTTQNALTGGIAGFVLRGEVLEARALVDVLVNQDYAGLVVGFLQGGTIRDSFVRGQLFGNNASHLGGILGGQASSGSTSARIERVYSRVAITGSNLGEIGGITGTNNGSTAIFTNNNYYGTELTSFTSGLGTARTDTELRDTGNFVTWDFATIWQTTDSNENDEFMDLRWYYKNALSSVDVNAPTNFKQPEAGTETNPLEIATWENLHWLSQNPAVWDQLFVQTADIDLNDGDIRDWDDEKGWSAIGNINIHFTGGYDGQGHAIRNLYMNRNVQVDNASGLFGVVRKDGATSGSHGRIANLILEDVDISVDGSYVGGVTGRLLDGALIEQVAIQGAIVSLRTGGSEPIIVGGIVGDARNATIRLSRADVTIGSSPGSRGAFAGHLVSGEFENNIALGTVAEGGSRGGFTGLLAVSLDPITMTNNITLAELELGPGTSFQVGSFTTTSSAQLLTHQNLISMPLAFVGGNVVNPSFVTELNEQEIKLQSNLAGFDFDDLWIMTPQFNAGFPDLKWYVEAVDPSALVPGPLLSLLEAPANFGDAQAGTSANPYEITNWNQLLWISARDELVVSPNRIGRWGSHYTLSNDIDFADASIELDTLYNGQGWLPIGNSQVEFFGSFNGNHHTISNVYVNNTENRFAGFFGALSNNGEITQLHVEGTVIGNSELSAPFGATGGIVGEMSGTTSLSYSSFTGIVESVASNNSNAGGLVGRLSSGIVTESFAHADVSGAQVLGGLIGQSSGTVRDSYALGTVAGNNNIGGIAGIVSGGAMERTYASVTITSVETSQVSGGIGQLVPETTNVEAVYFRNAQSGDNGLSVTEMRQRSSFGGFDFGGIWQQYVDFNDGYPYLDWEREGENLAITNVNDRGWHVLSVPQTKVSFSRLASENQVQGIPGVNALYVDGFDYETGITPNIFSFDAAAQEYVAPVDVDSELQRGAGFIWYLFNNNAGASKELPMSSIWLPGSLDTDDLEVDLEPGWNLMGNPYGSQIDVSTGIAGRANNGNLASNTVMIWDASTSSWIPATQIPPFFGFYMDNDNANSFTFDEDMISPLILVEEETATSITLEFELSAGNLKDRSASLVFHEEATVGWDMWDARKLDPLSSAWVTLAFEGERNGEIVRKSRESLPLHSRDEIRIPMFVEAQNVDSDLTLNWGSLDGILEDWNLLLTDLQTGNIVNLRDVESVTFALPEDVEKPRFELIITSGETTSAEFVGDLPTEIALLQNYPNPFNPTTVLSFDLPENGQISLRVYDTLGRQVATLVNSEMTAGRHTISFDASHLASGMYIYRLQAGTQVLTKTMTLIK